MMLCIRSPQDLMGEIITGNVLEKARHLYADNRQPIRKSQLKDVIPVDRSRHSACGVIDMTYLYDNMSYSPMMSAQCFRNGIFLPASCRSFGGRSPSSQKLVYAYAGLDACQFSRHRFFRTTANKGIFIPANCIRQESDHCTNRTRKSIQSKLIDHISAFVHLSTAASRQPVVLKDIA